ncbi:hypothetical protein ABW19_dt0200442 [Dactylella cylindrospora]|nr:hypothetical protein ABW19_dt0200442 [Dactylella cylindrospora]
MLHILDNQGFKRIGAIKAAGHLLSSVEPVDSIILSRDLVEEEDFQSNERFEKIRYYLEKGKYPPSATRAEKSRLRSAATHYKLLGEKLMLKDKEVISDPQKQYEIARDMHKVSHGGINKTTAQIADKYHWIQIKKTVGQVLKNCVECTQNARPPVVKAISSEKTKDIDQSAGGAIIPENPNLSQPPDTDEEAMLSLPQIPAPEPLLDIASPLSHQHPHPHPQPVILDHSHRALKSPPGHHHHQLAQSIRSQHDAMSLSQRAAAQSVEANLSIPSGIPVNVGVGVGVPVGVLPPSLLDDIAVDPAMMDGVVHHHHHHHHHHVHAAHPHGHLAQHPQVHGHEDAIDEIAMMDNFDDIPEQFDADELLQVQQGLMETAGADGVMMDEEERRQHHVHTAALAEAALNSAARGDEGADGEGEDELDPFGQGGGVHRDYV